jgi:hypothetical protein
LLCTLISLILKGSRRESSTAISDGVFFVLAPSVEVDRPSSEQVGNMHIIRFNLLFLSKITHNRVLYRLLFNGFFSLSLLLNIARLRNLQVDVIQAEQQLSLIQSLIIGNILKKPVIVDDVTWINRGGIGIQFSQVIAKIVEVIFNRALASCAASILSSYYAREKYSFKCPTYVVPNGIAMPINWMPNNSGGKTLLFLGSMYSDQNRQAALATVEIFKEVKRIHKDAELIFAGGPNSMIDKTIVGLSNKDKSVKVLGYVSNELKNALILKATLILMPYFNSPLTGGCRIKALEFLSFGKVIVSSSDGMAGITGLENKKNVLLAETHGEFVEVISKYFSNPAGYCKIGCEATIIANNYSWQKVASSYKRVLLHIISRQKKEKSKIIQKIELSISAWYFKYFKRRKI